MKAQTLYDKSCFISKILVSRMKLTNLVVFIKLFTICSCNESWLNDMTHKILHAVFKPNYEICYVLDYTQSSEIVTKNLISNYVVRIKNYQTFLNFTKENCHGYVIASNDYEKLQNIFITTKFEPHKRVLLFFSDYNNFQIDPFIYSTYHLGIDILVIKGYNLERNFWSKKMSIGKETKFTEFHAQKDDLFKRKLNVRIKTSKNITIHDIYQTFTGNENEEEDIRPVYVISVKENKTLVTLVPDRNFDLDPREFSQKQWTPVFLNGEKFRASVFNCTPFIIQNSKRQIVDGIEYRMLKEIAKDWPLDFITHIQNDSVSVWAKNVLSVYKGDCQAALCSIFQYFAYEANIDMSFPYAQTCVTFLVPKPKLLPQSTYVFQPFQSTMWLLCICFTIFVAAVLRLFTYYGVNNQKHANFIDFHDFGVCFMVAFRSFTAGGCDPFPPPLQSVFRYVITVWLVGNVIISTGYSAGFTSSLTAPRFSKPINRFQDMVEQKILWGTPETDTLHTLRKSPQSELVELDKNFLLEISSEDRNARIRKGNYAIMTKQLPQRYVTDTENLDEYGKRHLKILFECVGVHHLVIGMGKNSPYIELFNNKIMRFIEYGLANHWYSLIRNKYSEKLDNFFSTYVEQTSKYYPLKLSQIQGIFYALIIGLILSCTSFLGELLMCYLQNKRPFKIEL